MKRPPWKYIYAVTCAIYTLAAPHMKVETSVALAVVGLFGMAVGGHTLTDLKHGGVAQ